MDRILPSALIDAPAADPVHERELFLLEWDITEELTTVIPQASSLAAPALPVF